MTTVTVLDKPTTTTTTTNNSITAAPFVVPDYLPETEAPAPDLTKASNVLRQGLDRLRGGAGWCQHVFKRKNERGEPMYCSLGTLGYANFSDHLADGMLVGSPTAEALSRLAVRSAQLHAGGFLSQAVRETGVWVDGIASWNDHPATTYEEVETGFLRAIELAEKAGQ